MNTVIIRRITVNTVIVRRITVNTLIVRITVNTECCPTSTDVQDEAFRKTRTDQSGGDVSHLNTGSVQFKFQLSHRLS